MCVVAEIVVTSNSVDGHGYHSQEILRRDDHDVTMMERYTNRRLRINERTR